MGLRAVQVWLHHDGLLLRGDAGSCIRFVLSCRTFLLSLTQERILICMQKKKKSLSDLFSKQQSVWQFTAFIKHYMVEVYHRSALISQSLQQVPAAYMLR